MGLRRRWWMAFFGVPRGLPGRVGVRLMPRVSRPFHSVMATELDLQPEDELLDVGCGSATMLADHAGHVRYVAGLDISELQLEVARRRLAGRVAAGTAEIVEGAADHVLRPGGRLAITMGEAGEAPVGAIEGVVDKWGEWQWTEDAAQRLMEEAGFDDVTVSVMPVFSKALLARGVKPAASVLETTPQAAATTAASAA